MVQAARKRCSAPGCNVLVRGVSRCPKHTKQQRKRTTTAKPFYTSTRWRKLRAAFLAENPLCVRCSERGRVVPAVVADHVIDRCDAPERAYDVSNLEALCVSCHNRKTARTVQRRRQRAGGAVYQNATENGGAGRILEVEGRTVVWQSAHIFWQKNTVWKCCTTRPTNPT